MLRYRSFERRKQAFESRAAGSNHTILCQSRDQQQAVGSRVESRGRVGGLRLTLKDKWVPGDVESSVTKEPVLIFSP